MNDDKKLVQCKSCPWRVDCDPEADIPNYDAAKHEGLSRTIAEPGCASILDTGRAMACHHSKDGAEFACAGWLFHQLTVGNNIGLRMQVMAGHMPVPEVEGEQHRRFEDTLPNREDVCRCGPKGTRGWRDPHCPDHGEFPPVPLS